MKIKRNQYISNEYIYNNNHNLKSMRISQKIYGFFGFCLFFLICVLSTAHAYQYFNRKIIPSLLSFNLIKNIKGYFNEELYNQANLVHEHIQVKKLREHQEFMHKTPKNEIQAKLYIRGHKCNGCPGNHEEYMNSHIHELKENKLVELKKYKKIDNYYQIINDNDFKKIENNNEKYDYLKKNNDFNEFKDFDDYLLNIFSFTNLNNIPYVILEFSPNILNLNNDLLFDYIENNYIKLNMYDINFSVSDHNILKYHICENYLGDDFISINPNICVYLKIFVFENGILKSIIQK